MYTRKFLQQSDENSLMKYFHLTFVRRFGERNVKVLNRSPSLSAHLMYKQICSI